MQVTQLSEEDQNRQSKQHRVEADRFILHADKKHLERGLKTVLDDIHHVKEEVKRLNVTLAEKELIKKSLEQKIQLVDADITATKRTMNTL